MDLDLDLPLAGHTIRRVEADAVIVDSTRLAQSFLLSPSTLLSNWPFTTVEQLDDDATRAILALKPELVLIGSGPRQVFVAPAIQAAFLRHGIGIECMDNRACARTFNLLAGEGRHVVAAVLLP